MTKYSGSKLTTQDRPSRLHPDYTPATKGQKKTQRARKQLYDIVRKGTGVK